MACTNTRKWRTDVVQGKVIGSLYADDVERVLSPPEPDAPDIAAGLRARIADAEIRRDRWVDAFDKGDDFAAGRIRSLREEIAPLKQDLKEASMDEIERASTETVGAVLCRARQIAERLAGATEDEAADLRRRLAQAIRELIVEIRCHPIHVVAIAKRRWRRPKPALSVVPPKMKDGKPVAEWEATITLVDERPPSAEELAENEWRMQFDLRQIEDIESAGGFLRSRHR
jgi:hypothetical protein